MRLSFAAASVALLTAACNHTAGPAPSSAPPEIITGTNGEGEVIFSNNCVVYYAADGSRRDSLPACSAGQISDADSAMAAYRREQGLAGPQESSAAPAHGQPVAQSDMARYCMGEASGAFNVSPRDIATLPVEQISGGYVVYGQYPQTGQNVTTFECHFDSAGVFRTVQRHS